MDPIDDPSKAPTVIPEPAVPDAAAADAAGTPQPETVLGEGARDSGATAPLYAFLGPPHAPDELGRLGSYRVLRVLGRGGMGVVFLAEDIRLGRQVALKAMLPDVATKPAARERFLREAKTAAAIEHDHIVAIFQVDEDRGVPFIAMPLLKGCSLEDWLRERHDRLAPVPIILKLGKQIAQGLAAAHAHGLIHRDIKPGNIFLQSTQRGSLATGSDPGISASISLAAETEVDFRVKVLDFGLARSSAGEQNLTQSGVIMGTPAYMAPEQARSGSKVDGRADLFSLGVVLYRLTTGTLPFKGEDTMSTLMALAMDIPAPPAELNPKVSRDLSSLVMSLLEKDPARRIATADEVVRTIEVIEALLAVPTVTPPSGLPVAWGVREVPLKPSVPPPVPRESAMPEAPANYDRGVPPLPGWRADEEIETVPRQPPEFDENPDYDIRDLRVPLKEDNTLSLISMIVGIVSAVLGVFSMCCCGVGTAPFSAIGGGAALTLGIMGYKRGGRNQAIAGMILGGAAVVLSLVAFAMLLLGASINLANPGGGRR